MKDAESRVMLEASGKGDGGRAANVRAAEDQLVHERKVRLHHPPQVNGLPMFQE